MQGCPGRCIYCDQFSITGQDDSELDPSLQAASDFLRRNAGIPRQVAFYGGSFTALEPDYRQQLIDRLLPDMDDLCSFRISTHPLYMDGATLDWCRKSRIHTIELGIQDFSDEVLGQSGRGYSSRDAQDAFRMVKNAGFETGVQLMPGLPGWTPETIAVNHACVSKIKPDLLRIYPVIVIGNTPLAELWQNGSYKPLHMMQAISQGADWAELCQAQNIRLIKLGLPSTLKNSDVLAGPWHPAFGELVKGELLMRELQRRYPPGSIIKLDKNQRALMMAHGGFFLKMLPQRLRNCTLEFL